jgi:hypothetical protein
VAAAAAVACPIASSVDAANRPTNFTWPLALTKWCLSHTIKCVAGLKRQARAAICQCVELKMPKQPLHLQQPSTTEKEKQRSNHQQHHH